MDEGRDLSDYMLRRGAQASNRWWARKRRVDRVYIETGPGIEEYERGGRLNPKGGSLEPKGEDES
jgi:hypothetical protein